MANTTIQIKKSATPAAAPSSLANGELAINYADGKLFYKAANGTIVQFSTSESNSFGTVNANSTLLVSDTTGDVLTIVPGNNITVVGDAVNDKITVGLQDSPTFYGDTTVRGGGKFIAGAVGGDEGGEILLEKPPNGTLDGGVTIDAYQNKLRIFEQGGSARGVYIDLSAAGAGVSTNLLAGGGGTTDTTARATAEAAFAKANSANYYAYLVDANSVAAFGRANSSNTVVVANVNYVNTAMQAAFAQANNSGPGTNTYLLTVIAGANTAVGTGANTYLLATIAGANTAVGGGANNYLLAVIAGANAAVGTGANTVGSAAFDRANTSNAVAIANVNYVNTAMQAAFAQVNVAIANVNYVNTAMQAAFDKANTGGGASVNVGNAVPVSPTLGTLWWNTDLARMFVYYTDANSSQWVEASPAVPGPAGPAGSIGPAGPAGANGAVGPSGPKAISIPVPQAGDEYTIMYTTTAQTVRQISAISYSPIAANTTVNATFFFGSSRASGTTILNNWIVGNTNSGNTNTSFTTAAVTANTFVWIKINSVVNSPAEFAATIDFT